MATAQSPNDLTRQQLDELDALLQRMLALPLNSPEGVAPTVSSPTTYRPTVSELPLPDLPTVSLRSTSASTFTPQMPASAPTQSSVEMSPPVVWRGDAPSTSGPTQQLLTIPSPSDPTPAPITRKAPSSHARSIESGAPATLKLEIPTQPIPSQNPFKVNTNPPPVPHQVPDVLPSQPAPAKITHVSPVLAPLVAFNRVLNAFLGQLGLVGRILRSGFIKNLVGLAGIALLAYTGAKIVQDLHWVTFPIALPWPT
jgi:hypothetical protein